MIVEDWEGLVEYGEEEYDGLCCVDHLGMIKSVDEELGGLYGDQKWDGGEHLILTRILMFIEDEGGCDDTRWHFQVVRNWARVYWERELKRRDEDARPIIGFWKATGEVD